MTKEELAKIDEYFECYQTGTFVDSIFTFYNGHKAKRYFHKEHDNFHLVVFVDDDVVYQGGTEADTIGCELETFEELVIRFESFTRDKIDNIEIRSFEDV